MLIYLANPNTMRLFGRGSKSFQYTCSREVPHKMAAIETVKGRIQSTTGDLFFDAEFKGSGI